jgi:ribosomal protein S18 acetylase RimI-like enzyme
MRIREAVASEYPEIAALTAAAFREYRPILGDPFWHHYRAEIDLVRERAAVGRVFVAEVEGQIAGSVALLPPGLPRDRWAHADAWTMRMLATLPHRRSRGVGRALVCECLERVAREGGALSLTTAAFMRHANCLYRSLGFRLVEERPSGHGFAYRVMVTEAMAAVAVTQASASASS